MEIQEFIEKFAETLDVEDTVSLTGETEFRDLDEWSSLSVIILIAFFYEELEKEISDKDIRSCITLGDLHRLSLV